MTQLSLGHKQITQLLPHRRSMLLVDEITQLIPGLCAVGRCRVDPALPVLKGHFAGDPTLPGAYTMEIAAQAAHLLILSSPEFADRSPAFLGLSRSRFYRRVRPGDQLEIRAELLPERPEDETLAAACTVSCEGEAVAALELVFSLRGLRPAEKNDLPPLPDGLRGCGSPISMSNSDLLAHTRIRDPYRLLDEIPEIVPGKYAIGRFYAPPGMEAAEDYCPQDPILPPCYLVEATEQLGGLCVACCAQFAGKRSLLLGINRVRIYRNVRPGETVETYSCVTNVRNDKFIVTYSNNAYVAGELAAQTEVAIALR